MSFKDILAPVTSLAQDEAALRAVEMIAARFEAHATALIVAVHLASHYRAQALPLSTILEDIAAGANNYAARERANIIAWLERASIEFEARDVLVEEALNQKQVLAHARRSDLVVLARPPAPDRAHDALFEDLLFGAGRPMLLMPSAWRGAHLWDRILIGWDAGREASRAVADALPFLKLAREVVVATVDAAPSQVGHGPAPGHGLGTYLARHGVRVTVCNLDGLGRSEGAALIDQARAMDANMIVMGGYGHSRAGELIFGGVTRELSRNPVLPLLLSH